MYMMLLITIGSPCWFLYHDLMDTAREAMLKLEQLRCILIADEIQKRTFSLPLTHLDQPMVIQWHAPERQTVPVSLPFIVEFNTTEVYPERFPCSALRVMRGQDLTLMDCFLFLLQMARQQADFNRKHVFMNIQIRSSLDSISSSWNVQSKPDIRQPDVLVKQLVNGMQNASSSPVDSLLGTQDLIYRNGGVHVRFVS
jgi:hypothetical protein